MSNGQYYSYATNRMYDTESELLGKVAGGGRQQLQ